MENIDNFIEKIISRLGRNVLKERDTAVLHKARYVKYMDYSGDKPTLNARKYLKDVPRRSLEVAIYHFNIPGYKKMTDDELINTKLKNDKCKDIVINLIKKRYGTYFKQYVIDYLQSGEYGVNIS